MTIAIEQTTASAPAHWASYIVNGDASGLEFSNTPDNNAGDRDIAACDAWLASLAADGWSVTVDSDREPEFRHTCDARAFAPLAGDMLEYTLYRRIESAPAPPAIGDAIRSEATGETVRVIQVERDRVRTDDGGTMNWVRVIRTGANAWLVPDSGGMPIG